MRFDSQKIKLFPNALKVNKGSYDGNGDVNCISKGGSSEVVDAKSYAQAYFTSDYHFYYFSYNNIYDFESGYSKKYIDFTDDNSFSSTCSNPDLDKKTNSPLAFIDNVEIQEMNFIPGTKYVYYKIYNQDKNEIYYGFIDLNLNKVVYNIKGNFKSFIPISTNEMLAVSETAAYKICVIKTQSHTCSDSCGDGKNIILDPNGNRCDNDCELKLMPEGICIDENSCDSKIYELRSDLKQCGLCSYFNPEGAKYKFISTEGCISTIPANADYYNVNLKILKCKTNYHLDNGKCIPDSCYDLCATCSEYGTGVEEQKCVTCKSGYIIDENKNCQVAPTTIVIPPTTIIIPPTTVIIPPTTVIIPPTTVIIPSTTVIIPPTTVMEPPTTIIIPPSTMIIPPSTVIIPPSTIITPSSTVIIPPSTVIFPPTTAIEPPTTVIIPPTTIPEKLITTIPEIVPLTHPFVKCFDIKCLECNEESTLKKLCLSCNEALGYKKVNYTLVYTNFVDCRKKEDPLLKNFYYNETNQEYRPCYKTCKKCSIGGDAQTQNCLECENNYMFRPGENPHNNCVAYSEFYYIDSYNQYKSMNSLNCPEEAKYVIKEKKSCIYDCKKDDEYRYLYNGQCLKSCPSDTTNNSFVCTERKSKAYLGVNDLYIKSDEDLNIVNNFVNTYISEFSYTNNHATLYDNDFYNILVYKNPSIINDLSLKMSRVDFQDCYDRVKAFYHIEEDLVITVVDKKNTNNPSSSYSFFHPKSGIKLDAENICKDDVIVVKENLTTILNTNDTKYELQSSLTDQGINIFDANDPFYTDLCFDYDNPKKRDMPLSDRIKHVFPNVTLCNDGCQMDGINLEDMTATCNCKFNDISNNEVIKDNAVLDSMVGEIFDIINSSNILVVKCYDKIFKYFKNSIGGIFTATIIALNLILTNVFFARNFPKITDYIRGITYRYLTYLSMSFYSPPKRASVPENKRKSIKKSSKRRKTMKVEKKEEITNLEKKYNITNEKEEINKKGKNKRKSMIHRVKKNSVMNNMYTSEYTDDYLDKNDIIRKFVEEYMETPPDDMEYDDAIKKDDRTFCEYFKDNLKEKQIIANTFIAEDPIKSRSIKIILFSLNLVLYFVINGLFISEDYISELYNINEDEENFFSFLPRSITRLIYTTIVSLIIGYITGFFFLEEKKVVGIFKRDKDNRVILKESIDNLIDNLKTRYISFIIVVFVILLLSLYYLLCFNYVYPKTQIEWIKSSIAIIIIIQILSVLQILLEAIIRFLSFACESEQLFKFGKIFS